MIKDYITWQIFKGLQKCQDKGIIVYQAMAHRFQTAQKQDVFLYPDVNVMDFHMKHKITLFAFPKREQLLL